MKALSDALSAVAAYVPSEVIAIYTFVIATTINPKTAAGEAAILPMWTFYAFLIGTPIMVCLLALVRMKAENAVPTLWQNFAKLPWWEPVAATIAFTAWSAAMPCSAFSHAGWYSANVAGVALVITSALLPLFGRLFEKK
jgi:hypothetical protein